MTIALDFFGYRYNDATAPSFVELTDKLCFHRPTGRMLDTVALMAEMADEAYIPSAKEKGKADAWALAHLGMATSVTPPAGGGTAAIAAAADLTAKTVTISGGPADKGYSVTVTYQIDGSGTDVTKSQSVAANDTAAATAAALAAKFTGTLTATAAGGVITIALGTAATLDTLSVTVA